MKRIIASAGLAALGAASMQAATPYSALTYPGLTPAEQTKPWSVGLAVRGFYDDNYTTSPNNGVDPNGNPVSKKSSWGVDVSPSAAVNLNLDQTQIGLSYIYDMRWYADRQSNEADHIQVANLSISHAFSERYKLDVSDKFVYAQEGNVAFDGSGPITTPTVLETDADYLRNVPRVAFSAGLTEKIALNVAYKNEYWDYKQQGPNSRSALLDRSENLFTLEGAYFLQPATSALIGYQYGTVNHLRRAPDLIFTGYYSAFGVPIYGDPNIRDAKSHYIYGGVDHNFNPQLNGAVRLGAQITHYPYLNDLAQYGPVNADDNSVIPYADAHLTWTYNPGSSLTLGVINTLNQTDVAALAQESVAVYGSLTHRITPKVTGSVVGTFQDSKYKEGIYNGEVDLLYLAGVNLTYAFNPNLAAEAGYNFDRLDSDLPSRSYSRNRVYFGLRATY